MCALLKSDFKVVKPHRSWSEGPVDTTLVGKVNPSSDGGLIFDATVGAGLRNTIPADITTTNTDADNIEMFTDGDAPDDVNYHQFVHYMKIYVLNGGEEDLLNPSFTVTGKTRVDNTTTNIVKKYYALGFVDESDYAERSSTSSADDYPDETREGFPRIRFDDGDSTIGGFTTKVAENIVRIGTDGTAPTGPHPVIRRIDKDYSLYAERKYIKATWSGTISPSFYLFVFGEVNSAPVIGKVLCTGAGGTATVVNAVDSSAISFDKIYAVVTLNNATTATCWNDVDKGELINPSQDLTISYQVVGDSTWSTWSSISTTQAFCLTFFDENILTFDTAQRLYVSTNTYGLHQVADPTTTHSSVLHSGFMTATISSPDPDLCYVDFDSPDIDLLGINPGDFIVGFEGSTERPIGWVTEIDQSPNYPSLVVSLFDSDFQGFDGWGKVYDGQRSRFGFWVREEVTCQDQTPEEYETNSIFRVYGRTAV